MILATGSGEKTGFGHVLGDVKVIERNIDYAAVLIVFVSVIPVALEYRRGRREVRAGAG